MIRSKEELIKEVHRRVNALSIRREKRVLTVSTGSALLFSVVLLAVIRNVPHASGKPVESEFGAFLLSPEAGGYVLAGVLAFLLGIGFTLLMQRIRKIITEREIRRIREECVTKPVALQDRQIMAVSGGNEEEAQLKKE